jgi:HAD superfamily hydrolase (TIGR01490 family)
MALALFDLDNTLLNGDSDHSWGTYLADIGAVDPKEHKLKHDAFYQQYLNGSLNIIDFLDFQLAVLAQYPLKTLHQWRDEYLRTIITPMINNGKSELLDEHRGRGDELVIITATNDFVTAPIASMLGVDNLIATSAEFNDGKYTGKVIDTPCFQDGKVTRLRQWMKNTSHTLNQSWFYSDSYNDLPLMQLVDHPVAVTPDSQLRAHALEQHWPIID